MRKPFHRFVSCPLTRTAAAAVLALSLWPAAAQPADPVLQQASAQIASGQAEAAYRLLEPLEASRAADPSFSYLLGIAAIDAGQTTRAIFALERTVAMQPDNNLARAELARAYLAAGEAQSARDELQAARRGPMPAEAAAAIDRVLGFLDQEPPVASAARRWRGYGEAVIGHDSNVNSATAAGQFALPAFGGVVFNLDPQNRARSDAFGALGAGVGLRLPVTPAWELDASLNARQTWHRQVGAMDNRSLDASVGASYTVGAHRLSGAVQATQYDIDHMRYRRATGLTAQWQYSLDSRSQLSLFAQHSRLAYGQDSARDADRSVAGAGYARAFGEGRQVVYGSVYRAVEKPRARDVDNYGHHAIGVRLGAEAAVAEGRVAFAAVQFERRRYGGMEPFFDARRTDRQFDATAGMHFTLAPQWRLSPQVSFARADSNVVLYAYRRVVWQLALRRDFD